MKIGKQEYEMIGFLPNGSLNDIRIGKNDFMFFYITPLSDFPNSITEDIERIQIYATELRNYGFDERRDADRNTRVESLSAFLKGMVIICTPEIIRGDSGEVFCRGSNVHLFPQNEMFDPKIKYVPLPTFSKKTISTIKDEETFADKLYSFELVGRINQYSKDSDDYPSYVIWENDENDLSIYGEIKGQSTSQYGMQYKIDDTNKLFGKIQMPEDEDWFDSIYKNEDIMFIPANILESKQKDLKAYSKIEKKDGSFEKDSSNLNVKPSSINLSNPSKVNSLNNDVPDNSDKEYESEELGFLRKLENVARNKKGLFYNEKDVVNFHVAMKSNGLVILSGLSGTGKSKLVETYATALNLTSSQKIFIPVRPFWSDDSDLIGYADTVNSVYRPGDSGLVDALIAAEENPNNMYLICFDEMNLAKVEHYFSQFLSVLEMNPEDRRLRLYNPELENRLYNSQKYKSEITIGENVLFVGTINTDESTHQFSDKVLDRSNLISLQMVPFYEIEEDSTIQQINQPNLKQDKVTYENFKSFKKSVEKNELTKQEKEMFWKIHLELTKHDRNIGIGWRVLNQINEYLNNIPVNSVLSRSEALDYQIVQRILPKIRGSEEQLADMLGSWNRGNNEMNKGTLELILDEYIDSSSFVKSRKLIEQKARELVLHGFTV